MPRYSLVIPHFNDARRLARLLHSVPIDREDIEILVVDDCTPDQTLLEKLKVTWPKVNWLTTMQNRGAGAARNVGLRNASGERLLFADSDDEFVDGAFDVLDKYADTKDDLIYFLAEAVRETDGTPSNRADGMNELCWRYLKQPTYHNLAELKLRHVNPVAKMYSRVFIEGTGVMFEETRVSNDIAFNVLAAFQAQAVRVVPETVYRIYRRTDSLTSNPSPEVFLERVRCQSRLATALRKLEVNERPSATGWMLASIAMGPRTAFKTWRIFSRSDLRIQWARVFEGSRWRRFLNRWLAIRNEKRGQ